MLMKVISGWGGVVFSWCLISRKISGSRCFKEVGLIKSVFYRTKYPKISGLLPKIIMPNNFFRLNFVRQNIENKPK